jgi:hypothetical protein
MYWSQVPQVTTPENKRANEQSREYSKENEMTIEKNYELPREVSKYDQVRTPPVGGNCGRKGIVFLGNNQSKHLFPLYRDEEIGIRGELQRRVHSSHHDDDRMTTTTQMGLAISQTC